jgi:hypothetical protein
VIHYDPSGLNPSTIFASSARQGSAAVGLPSEIRDGEGQPLFYSGSGQDSLHQMLRQMVTSEQISDAQRAADAEFAKGLSVRTLEVDVAAKRAVVQLGITRQGQLRTTAPFEVTLLDNFTFEAGALNTNSSLRITGRCMDIDSGCRTVLLKVQDGSASLVRVAYIIWRDTRAALTMEGPAQGLARNEEYDRFYQILKNTKDYPNHLNTVSDLRLSTYEVIGGESRFKVKMTLWIADRGSNSYKETLNWTGPLVKPIDNDRMNIDMQALETQIAADGPPVAMNSPLIKDTIRGLRLVRNDGRGNLQISVTIRRHVAIAREETLTLTVARIHTPVRQLPALSPRPTQQPDRGTVPQPCAQAIPCNQNQPVAQPQPEQGTVPQSPQGTQPQAPQSPPCGQAQQPPTLPAPCTQGLPPAPGTQTSPGTQPETATQQNSAAQQSSYAVKTRRASATAAAAAAASASVGTAH